MVVKNKDLPEFANVCHVLFSARVSGHNKSFLIRQPIIASCRHHAAAMGQDAQRPDGEASQPTTQPGATTMTSEIAVLAAMITSSTSASESSLTEQDLARLLSQLDDANGMAKGMESKLDSMLEQLDDLLGVLEPATEGNSKT